MSAIAYPDVLLEGRPTVIERLDGLERALSLAPAVIDLVAASYGAQFETATQLLPEGTIRAHYYPDTAAERTARTDGMRSRILTTFVRGGVYQVISCPNDADRLVGLVKTLPRKDGSCYVGDILVRPELQKNGYGSALLHSALCGYDPQRPADLEGYDGSPVNQWYRQVGFEPGEPCDSWFIQGHELSMTSFATPPHVAIGGVLQALEGRRPVLQNSVLL